MKNELYPHLIGQDWSSHCFHHQKGVPGELLWTNQDVGDDFVGAHCGRSWPNKLLHHNRLWRDHCVSYHCNLPPRLVISRPMPSDERKIRLEKFEGRVRSTWAVDYLVNPAWCPSLRSPKFLTLHSLFHRGWYVDARPKNRSVPSFLDHTCCLHQCNSIWSSSSLWQKTL